MPNDIKLYHGDCMEMMKGFEENSIDAVVTDPPYNLAFMGKEWDKSDITFKVELWREVLRALKPGGHALIFGGTRTYHRMACAVEDGGFEIRDTIHWCYGSGFPKSLDIGNAIDKNNGKHLENLNKFGKYIKEKRLKKDWSLRELDEIMGTNTAASWWEGRKSGVQLPSKQTYEKLKKILGLDNRFDYLIDWMEAERKILGKRNDGRYKYEFSELATMAAFYNRVGGNAGYNPEKIGLITIPATEAAKKWDGWGSALKPAHEMILLARKPLSEPNIAQNVLKWGAGGINVDGCRIGMGNKILCHRPIHKNKNVYGDYKEEYDGKGRKYQNQGRFPANFILSHSEGCVRKGEKKTRGNARENKAGGCEFFMGGDKRENAKWGNPGNLETVEDWICEELCPIRLLDGQSGKQCGAFAPVRRGHNGKSRGIYGDCKSKGDNGATFYADTGSASRFFKTFEYEPFFYCAKASRRERGEGNRHPTVKPVKLMRYLCRLITPPDGIVLDPFMGSGSTGIACTEENFNFIGIEKEREYFDIAEARINHAKNKPRQAELEI